jgi:hypothetical protein
MVTAQLDSRCNGLLHDPYPVPHAGGFCSPVDALIAIFSLFTH